MGSARVDEGTCSPRNISVDLYRSRSAHHTPHNGVAFESSKPCSVKGSGFRV